MSRVGKLKSFNGIPVDFPTLVRYTGNVKYEISVVNTQEDTPSNRPNRLQGLIGYPINPYRVNDLETARYDARTLANYFAPHYRITISHIIEEEVFSGTLGLTNNQKV